MRQYTPREKRLHQQSTSPVKAIAAIASKTIKQKGRDYTQHLKAQDQKPWLTAYKQKQS